jgi:hypothetical protein
MNTVPDEVLRERGWVVDDNLYRVGFNLPALPMIKLMSGLVDIYAVEYDFQGHVLFYVKRTDKTRALFNGGSLVATPVYAFHPPPQSLQVDEPNIGHSAAFFC